MADSFSQGTGMAVNPEGLSRLVVPELDRILGAPFRVLNDGFVRVVDYMGNDGSVVQAARVFLESWRQIASVGNWKRSFDASVSASRGNERADLRHLRLPIAPVRGTAAAP